MKLDKSLVIGVDFIHQLCVIYVLLFEADLAY